MPRFQVMAGKHYQRERFTRDGQEIEAEFEYAANDATCNIVDTDKCVDGPIDLEERYNQRGFSEKFRRMPDEAQEVSKIGNDAFLKEAIRRGLVKEGEASPQLMAPGKPPTTSEPIHNPNPQPATGKPHPALANLAKTPRIGLEKLAEDEEIDITGCKDEGSLRRVIEAALKARK